MGFFGFAASHVASGDVETGLDEQAPEIARREAGMPLAVTSGDLVLLVAIEAEKNEAPAGTKHAAALCQSASWVLGVRQRVKNEHGIERRRAER
jgi:hypothetical protein